jgi:hypothetical protein
MKSAPHRFLAFMFFVGMTGLSFAQGQVATKTAPDRPSLVYVRDNKVTHIENITTEEAKVVTRSIHGEFIWYREGGKVYLIRDTGVLAKFRVPHRELVTLINTRSPAVSSGQDEAGMKAVREHARILREKIKALNESIHSLMRDAIKDGLATPTPPSTVGL